MEEAKKLPTEDFCFGCGEENPIGLHLDFTEDAQGRFVTKKVLTKNYQSYHDVVHGGIVTTLMDEAMGGYLHHKGEHGVTGTISVRFHLPTPIGEEIEIAGWEVSRRRNLVNMKAQITLKDGKVAAEATAKMVIVE